jgi:hypothetical protein
VGVMTRNLFRSLVLQRWSTVNISQSKSVFSFSALHFANLKRPFSCIFYVFGGIYRSKFITYTMIEQIEQVFLRWTSTTSSTSYVCWNLFRKVCSTGFSTIDNLLY